MIINRPPNAKPVELNIVGSSVFGRYPKISQERTMNMFQSDSALVPYAGYQIAILSSFFDYGIEGRGLFYSVKFNQLVVVISTNVYLVTVTYDELNQRVIYHSQILIGQLDTSSGVVYIAENNKPQVLLSDGVKLYLYDPSVSPTITKPAIDFTPGYITFHDTYFISPSLGTNQWRISDSNDGSQWPSTSGYVGALQTKPDNCFAVIRFPSKGNMIFVMGSIVSEAWFDTGAQLFPYQRNNQFNIDYGCVSPATIAYMDEFVIWLGQSEKSGPIVLYSDGGMPRKVSTDGVDFLFAQLQNPQDSQAFVYRQDGHLFYHLNFYSDNLSLFFDFLPNGEVKVYNACDQLENYFIASKVAFFDNQYYFVSINNGNLYAFDTIFNTYQDTDANGTIQNYFIPRYRICKNIRTASQSYFIINDIGFTIETGETDYVQQIAGGLQSDFLLLDNTNFLLLSGQNFELLDSVTLNNVAPVVALSLSYDGGATFGHKWEYQLNAIGNRRNRLMWWQCGISNDSVPRFDFIGIGRFVCLDGVAYIRE